MVQRKPWQVALLSLALLLGILAAYWPVSRLDFTNYDDPYYVTENPQVKAGVGWTGIKWAFTNTSTGNWHPLTWLSHMLDAEWFGLNPAGHHATSLFFHAANSVLLFLLFLRLTGGLWRSWFVAGLFALHPLHVESVAWVSERKDLLSTFFGLLCLWAYAEKQKAANQKWKSILHLASLGLFACGLMSKAMLVTWPFVMLLLEWWPLARIENREQEGKAGKGEKASNLSGVFALLREKALFFLLAAISCVVTFLAQKAGGAVAPLEQIGLWDRMLNAPLAYVIYLRKLVWPTDLAVIYPYGGAPSTSIVVLALFILAGITALVFWQRQTRPFLVTGWLWYLGTLVPVIGLVQVGNQALADRYTYIPSIGVFLMVVFAMPGISFQYSEARQKLYVGFNGVSVLAGTVALVLCGWLTYAQAWRWKDSETLFLQALKITRNNFIAANSLGGHYLEKGRLEEAAKWYGEALSVNPNSQYAWSGLGRVALAQGRFEEAVTNSLTALRLDAKSAEAHTTLAQASMRMGKGEDALRHYREVVQLRPDLAPARYNLANALAASGQVAAAREQYEAAIRLDPQSADAHNNLGYMLWREGKLDQAINQFQLALKLKPDFWQAHYGLGQALERNGQKTQATEHLRQAAELRARAESRK